MNDVCIICYDKINYNNCFKLNCQDTFCIICIKNYIIAKINDCDCNILCPLLSCKKEIDYSIIKYLMEHDDFIKYDKLLLNKMVLNSNDMSYCTLCENICVKYDNSLKTVCDNCNNKYCYVCKDNWSKNHICDENKFNDLITSTKLILSKCDIKYCPKCKVIIHKDGGCLAVTCKICNTKFCWNCLKQDNYFLNNPHTQCNLNMYIFENNEGELAEYILSSSYEDYDDWNAEYILGSSYEDNDSSEIF